MRLRQEDLSLELMVSIVAFTRIENAFLFSFSFRLYYLISLFVFRIDSF